MKSAPVYGILALLLIGCGDESPPGASLDATGADDVPDIPDESPYVPDESPYLPDESPYLPDDGWPDETGEPDVPETDTRTNEDVPDGGPYVPDDGSPEETSSPTEGEGGWPCTSNADCKSQLCGESSEGMACMEICVSGCPEGHECKAVVIPGSPDIVFACFAAYARLCVPCNDSADCAGVSSSGAACVDLGPQGRFCGGKCDPGCPEGYSCSTVMTAEGTEAEQCVPDDGTCECSPLAISLGSSTTCAAVNEHGSCPGVRSCGSEGLTACDAAQPDAESCNGADDDCDGETDEDLGEETCGVGACQVTVASCQDGAPVMCEPVEPAPAETCDGLDDDCDGETDEGFTDTDGDQLADCVDLDIDDDGVLNDLDNCLVAANPAQADTDGDGFGDVCDGGCWLASDMSWEVDCDGVSETVDNCPLDFNPNQTNTDHDPFGDACDPDDDGDGALDADDCAPLDPAVHPGAVEVCNGADDDCDEVADNVGVAPDVAAPGPEHVLVHVTSQVGLDDEILPIPLAGLDLPGVTAENVRVAGATGAALPLWVEQADPLVLWVRVSLEAGVPTPLIVAWGDAEAPGGSDETVFDWSWTAASGAAPAAGSWTGGSGPDRCANVDAQDVTTSVADGVGDVYRPSQNAFRWYPDGAACLDPTAPTRLRARIRMLTDHPDLDLGAGLAFVDDPADAVSADHNLPPAAATMLFADDQTERLWFRGGCASNQGESAPTTVATGDWHTFEVEVGPAGLTGGVDDGPRLSVPLAPQNLGFACAMPYVRGNSDGWTPGEIHFQVEWMHAVRPAPPVAITACAGGTITPLVTPEQTDGDADGSPDGEDCGPANPAVHPGAPETCNLVDDDCNEAVDEGCQTLMEFEAPPSSAPHAAPDWSVAAFNSAGCALPAISNGKLVAFCPNNEGLLAWWWFPHPTGEQSALRIEVDVTTTNCGDVAPRAGVDFFPDPVPPGYDGFGSRPGYSFLLTDPVDGTQTGCPLDRCPQINKDGWAGAELAGSEVLMSEGATYRLVIELGDDGIVFRIEDDLGDEVATLTSSDTDYREGYVGLFCAEATCAFDNLLIEQQ